ncbi:uncharacterized protein C8R40DRAFT_1174733 [Lentinula edodes]|uniref:uncharacterized protein n=1 Tax=Lentinula edodes TaxID=5353 RepID=UPI001E8E894D|nr:uncharacterized protein C8R40DRAFT_1174733 [Lentinula edodes]KAH7871311.1 hypothetical protein C8R40DRAFT_1174733 [Lentinula edodes]
MMSSLTKETKGFEHDAEYNHEMFNETLRPFIPLSLYNYIFLALALSTAHRPFGTKPLHQRMWSIVASPNTKIPFKDLFPGVVGSRRRLTIDHAALTNKLNESSFCRTTISVVREEDPGDKTLKQPLVLCTLVPMIEQARLDFTLLLDSQAGYLLAEGPNSVNISMQAAPSENERVGVTGQNKAKTHSLPSTFTSVSLETANSPSVDSPHNAKPSSLSSMSSSPGINKGSSALIPVQGPQLYPRQSPTIEFGRHRGRYETPACPRSFVAPQTRYSTSDIKSFPKDRPRYRRTYNRTLYHLSSDRTPMKDRNRKFSYRRAPGPSSRESITNMTNTPIASTFFRLVTPSPPVIYANRPLASDVVRVLEVMQAMSLHLWKIPSFQIRYAIVEPEWTRIWTWLMALLKPLDDFVPASPTSKQLSLATTSRCLKEVFSLLESIASPTQSTPTEFNDFVINMMKHPEALPAFAKVWVLSFTRQWSLSVYHPVMQFLIAFRCTIEDTPSDNSFHLAVRNAFPDFQLLPTWSSAIEDLLGQQVPSYSSNPEHRLATANQGMVLAATTLFLPLPRLDGIHIMLKQIFILWTQCLDTPRSCNAYLENICFMSVYCLARFSSRLIVTGGPNWIVKALDAKLLHLMVKTLVWMQIGPQSKSESSMFQIVEQFVNALLIHSVYKSVQKRIRRNLKGVRSESLEGHLGSGSLWRLWVHLTRAVCSPDARYASVTSFRKALKEVCSNEKCPHQYWAGKHSRLCSGCLIAIYCSRSCQRQDWKAGHGNICSEANLQRLTHPTNLYDDARPIIGDLDQVQLIFRGLIQAIECRDAIRHSIRTQGLHASRIVIEFNLTCYPWTWKVSRLAQTSANSHPFLSQFGIRPHHDTVVAVKCPCSMNFTKYAARSIHRKALLKSYHEGNRPSKDCLFRMLDDILCH